MCVMEMSHRSKVFQKIIDEAEQDLRDLMNIPDNYKVLFIQGGATLQFAMIPMNLMKNGVACYVETGAWSKKAINEAKKYGDVHVVASSKDRNYAYVPDCSNLDIPGRSCPTPRARFWYPTSPPCSSPSLATCPITA